MQFGARRQPAIYVIVRQPAPVLEHLAITAARFEKYLAVLAFVEHPPQRRAFRTPRVGLVKQIYVSDVESVCRNVI